MKIKSGVSIVSFKELNIARRQLKDDIQKQEEQIFSHPLVSIPTALLKGKTLKNSIKMSMESVSLEHFKSVAFNIIGTALMANKRTRKLFVGYMIAKEMIPFILAKLKEYTNKVQ